MKKRVFTFLFIVVLLFSSCANLLFDVNLAKKEIVEYYRVRFINIPESCIKYTGEQTENGYKVFTVDFNMDDDSYDVTDGTTGERKTEIKEKLYVSPVKDKRGKYQVLSQDAYDWLIDENAVG